MKRLFLLALLAAAATCLWAGDKLSGPTQIFLSDYAQSPARARAHNKAVRGNSIEAFVNVSRTDLDSLRLLGVEVEEQFGDGWLTARIPIGAIAQLEQLQLVNQIDMAQPVSASLDSAEVQTQAYEAHHGVALPHQFHGKGVVVGIVDSGFDFNHPVFKNSGGSGSTRIKYVYLTDSKKELTTESDINALTTDYANGTHGQHVAGIAAGTRVGNYGGMADSADIALAAMEGNALNTSIANGAKKIVQYAKSVGKPCVVNISYSHTYGPHDGTGSGAKALESLANDGAIIVLAAGNDGNRNFTLEHQFTGVYQSVATLLNSPSGKYSGTVESWGRNSTVFNVQYFIYDTSTRQEVYASDTYDYDLIPQTLSSKTSNTLEQYGTGTIKTATSKNTFSNRRYCVTTTLDFTPSASNYVLGIRLTSTSSEEQTINMWCTDGSTTLVSRGNKDYEAGDASHSINDMATGEKTISVGSYVSKRQYKNSEGTTYTYNGLVQNALAPSSSWGYDTSKKPQAHPDIAAPGAGVCSSVSRYCDYSASNVVMKRTYGGTQYEWGMMTGTSMAAPCVAGIIALWLEQDPTLTPEKVKETLRQTAITASPVTNAIKWGAGKINAFKPLTQMAGATRVKHGNLWYELNADRTMTVAGVAASGARSVTIEDFTLNGVKYQVTGVASKAMRTYYASAKAARADFDPKSISTLTFNATACKVASSDMEGVNFSVLIAGNRNGIAVNVPQYLATGNTSLRSLTLGSQVRTIATGAFSGCTGLDVLTLPATLTSVGSRAFSGCTGLKRVESRIANPTSVISQGAFGTTAIYNNTRLYVPLGSEGRYRTAQSTRNFKHMVARGTLAQVLTGTTTVSASNPYHYQITDTLTAVAAVADTLWLKDSGQYAHPSTPSGQAAGQDAAQFDQSNWVALTIANAASYVGRRIVPGTLCAGLTSRGNAAMTFTAGYDLDDSQAPIGKPTLADGEVPYAPNRYVPANFVSQATYFMVTPKPQEYAQVSGAVYVGGNRFYMASDSSLNPLGLAGGFTIARDYFTGSDFEPGHAYAFTAIVKQGSAALAPRRVYGADTTALATDFTVFPIAVLSDDGGGLRGDANGDNQVNASDVSAAVSYALGLEPSPWVFGNADVNNDGSLNASDVSGIVNIILGME